ncbi:hypothetical protein MTYP_03102 [Methylophilaceae bacterium]|nr:hypothetical protein MTYP_03102 [Methylophilaceae bacterium]
MTHAPVALFVYNRPWHTRQTVEALLANDEAAQTPLYIFSDAPKDASANKAVAEVRAYIAGITGFESVTAIERSRNFGLANSIIDGVTQVCQQQGRVIVLEDDIVTSPYFLRFMNDGLGFYENDERVISISGYVYPIKESLPETFFLRGADCWGWATWKRGWSLFEPDGKVLLKKLEQRSLTYAFDSNGTYPFTRMLKNQIKGKTNSWAIRWHATAFAENKLTLYPGRTLVHNIGVDGSGTNCTPTDDFAGDIATSIIEVRSIPFEENNFARQQVMLFHEGLRSSLPLRVLRKLKNILAKSTK